MESFTVVATINTVCRHFVTISHENVLCITAHERGHAGGGWGGSNDQSTQSGYKSQWSASKYHQASNYHQQRDEEEEVEEQREHLSSTGEDLSGYEQSSIEQEQRLVDEITAPGGVRAAPPRESLNKFITR